jgi:hypothetical protein
VKRLLLTMTASVAVACTVAAKPSGQRGCETGFPKGIFASSPEADRMMADRLWAILRTSNERALCEYPNVASRRIVVMPTFGRPRVLRIGIAQGRPARLVWVQLGGRGGYDLGTVTARRGREVPSEKAGRLQAAIAKLDPLMRSSGFNSRGKDGTVWLAESWVSQEYSASAAWSPGGELEEVLRGLLRAAEDSCSDCP